MRCLGIDFGEKRIGLAFGDELGVAIPLPAAVEKTSTERIDHLRRLVETRGISDLVVGYPLNMDGSVGFKAKEVDAFIAVLEGLFSLPVHRIDERLTSRAAEDGLKLSAQRERSLRASGIVDSAAAAIILQDWLSMKVPLPEWNDLDPEED